MPTPSPAGTSPKAFASELVKLLVQVAWADHDVAATEAETLLAFARRNGLGESELKGLGDMLAGRIPLAPPNLGVLKQRRDREMLTSCMTRSCLRAI